MSTQCAYAPFPVLAFRSRRTTRMHLFGLLFPGELLAELVDLVVIISRNKCVSLYEGDIERSCSQAD